MTRQAPALGGVTPVTFPKRANITRRVDLSRAESVMPKTYSPQSGDIVLAQVIEAQPHYRLDSPDGRKQYLFPGDEIITAYGNCYIHDKLEALPPFDQSPCELVTASGVASRLITHSDQVKSFARIKPISILADRAGHALNLRQFALPPHQNHYRKPLTIAVMGTATNTGKSENIVALLRGLRVAGYSVSTAIATGSNPSSDYWKFLDAGAEATVDFIDAGYPSTHQLPAAQRVDCTLRLLGHLNTGDPDIVLVDFDDPLLLAESASILTSREMRSAIDAVVMTASDVRSALFGHARLAANGWETLFVSGRLAESPAQRKLFTGRCRLPLLDQEALASGVAASYLPATTQQRVKLAVNSR